MKKESGIYGAIFASVRKIPRGKVATYGQVARISGLREHARVVGYALHTLKPGTGVPWHRVINSKGEISLPHGAGYERQRMLLEAEGVLFNGNRIDLSVFGASSAGSRRVRASHAHRRKNTQRRTKRKNRGKD